MPETIVYQKQVLQTNYFNHLFSLQVKPIIGMPNFMTFEPLFLKLLQFLDMQGSILD